MISGALLELLDRVADAPEPTRRPWRAEDQLLLDPEAEVVPPDER